MERKVFNTKLANVIRSAKTQRDNVQELIVAGLVHYEAHGDAIYLTDLCRALIGVKSLPTVTITEYIKAHANVGWGTLKDKRKGFKKIGKDVSVTMPDTAWYDWEGGKHNDVKADFDFRNSINRAITTAIARAKEGKLKPGQMADVQKVADLFGLKVEESA